jgi:hypothetical protein
VYAMGLQQAPSSGRRSRDSDGEPQGPNTPEGPDLDAVDWTPGRCRTTGERVRSHERGCPSVEPETNWTALRRSRMAANARGLRACVADSSGHGERA